MNECDFKEVSVNPSFTMAVKNPFDELGVKEHKVYRVSEIFKDIHNTELRDKLIKLFREQTKGLVVPNKAIVGFTLECLRSFIKHSDNLQKKQQVKNWFIVDEEGTND